MTTLLPLRQPAYMAKRRGGLARTTYQPAPRAASPVIRVSVPRPVALPKPKRPRRHKGGASGPTSGLTVQHMLAYGGAGAALGFIEEKFGSSLPTIPIVGKKGALAILAFMAAKHGFGGGVARDIAVAAAAVAGYQLGSAGKITGDYDE